MKRRVLAAVLALTLCMGNVAGIYAAEPETVVSDEEALYGEVTTEEESQSDSVEKTTEDADADSDEVTEEEGLTTEEATETGTETTEETTEELTLDSMTDSYGIDFTAPFSGDYLVMTNTKKLYSNSTDSIGAVPNGMLAEDEIELQEYVDSEGEGIMGYDEDGLGILDPNSYLPELVLDGEVEEPDEITPAAAPNYQIGDTKQFKLETGLDSFSYVKCVCVSVGNHCVVWVPLNDPIYVESPEDMMDYMDEVRDSYEDNFEKILDGFGSLDYADFYGDQDGKVSFICYDIQGNGYQSVSSYKAGYFWGADLNVNYSNKTGNNLDCLHIDSWHGMNRDTYNNTLQSPEKAAGTMMHEMQHMVAWSVMREIERQKGYRHLSLGIPSWINEAYAEAARHYCMYSGDDGDTGRAKYANPYLWAGNVSLTGWTGSLTSYSLSYNFAEYVRIQYSQKTGTSGWTVFRKAMLNMKQSSSDASSAAGAYLLDSIANELGITSEKLIENFWLAMYAKNAEGPYGFGGESWAESINVDPTQTRNIATAIRPGASQIVAINSSFTPVGAASSIAFASIDYDVMVTKEVLTVYGAEDIDVIGGTVELWAMTDKSYDPDVGWNVIRESENGVVSVNSDGVVRGLKEGWATIRCYLKSNPSVYDDVTINVYYDPSNDIPNVNRSYVNSGYGQKTVYCSVSHISNVKMYYTTDGNEATRESAVLDDDGIVIDTEGANTINILVTAAEYNDLHISETITLSKLDKPTIYAELQDDGTVLTEIEAAAGSDIFYTTDGSSPIDNGTEYTGSFSFVPAGSTVIKAVARKKGSIDSDIESITLTGFKSVTLGLITQTAAYGGYLMKATAKETGVTLTYTLDGKEPTRSSKVLPSEGVLVSKVGTTTFKVTGWKSGLLPASKSLDVTITKLNRPSIVVDTTNDGKFKVTMATSDTGAEIWYSLEGSMTPLEDGNKYTGPITLDTMSGIHMITAATKKKGYVNSDMGGYDCSGFKDISMGDVLTEAIYGGYVIKVTPSESDVTVTYTTNGLQPKKTGAVLPAEGITINTEGTTTFKATGWKTDCNPTTISKEITISKLNKPSIELYVDDDGYFDVEITCEDEGAEIFYTLDGSSPLENGAKYTGILTDLTSDDFSVVKAVARKKGSIDSELDSYDSNDILYVPTSGIIATPVYGGYIITETSTLDDVIFRYTLDGSVPSKTSNVLPAEGVEITTLGTTTVTVKAWKEGCVPVTNSYDVTITKLGSPVVTHNFIDYANKYDIMIAADSENSDAEIYYSLDDGEFEKYYGLLLIEANVDHTLKVCSRKAGCKDSDVVEKSLPKVEIEGKALTATPRVPVTVITLNKKYAAGTLEKFTAMPYNGEEILECSLTGDKAAYFNVGKVDDDELYIEIADPSVPVGSHKLTLNMRGTRFDTEPAKTVNITVKVVDKAPAIKVGKLTAYKNYGGFVMSLNVTSASGDVRVIGLKNKIEGFTDNFELVDEDGDASSYESIKMSKAYSELVTDAKKKPVMQGYLTVCVDGYVEQDVLVTIGMNNALPKIVQTVVPKYNYQSYVKDGCQATVNYTIVNSANKKVTFTSISDIAIDENSKLYSKVQPLLDSVTPVDFDVYGNVKIGFVLPDDGKISGTYTVPLLISGSSDIGEFSQVAVNAKFTVDKATSAIKATLAPASLMLNRQLDDHAYSTVKVNYPNVVVSDMTCTAMPATAKTNTDENVKLRYNAATSELEAYFDGYVDADSITCKTYKFECVPVFRSLKKEIVYPDSSQKITVTVSIMDKTPAVTAAAKGSINAMSRENTYVRYTVKKNGFFANYYQDADHQTVTIATPSKLGRNEVDGSEMFELTSDADEQFANNGTVDVYLKADETIVRGYKYAIRLAILLENGETVYSPDLKIVPTQPNIVLKQNNTPILYKSVNLRKRVSTVTLQHTVGEIETIKYNDAKNLKLPAALIAELVEENKDQIKVTLDTGDIKPGTYTINYLITYKGEMLEANGNPKEYPVAIKVTVK